MEKDTRQRLERLTQQARRLLEQEFREQLEGRYDILLDGRIPLAAGAHLSGRERVTWDKLVAAVAHKRAQGVSSADAVAAYLREAAFHTLNRFVALKMLEARGLLQECVSKGEGSSGFREFGQLVKWPDKTPPELPYRLYVESLFDEIAQDVRALFDRRDAATLLWPRRQALDELLKTINDPTIPTWVWSGAEVDPNNRGSESIGWIYQYFNGEDERRQMRAESQAPRNSRELAVRNQFFTPGYVVKFLTDNTLARTWCEMRGGDTQLVHRDYLVRDEDGWAPRAKKDPRELRILDPACGSGHFLLYAFDLLAGVPDRALAGIYQEAWNDLESPPFPGTGRTLRQDYPTIDALHRAVPGLVLAHNLHGADIDPRAAQIAALALWMHAQRLFKERGLRAGERPVIARTHVVTAEPMPGDKALVEAFAASLSPAVLGDLFRRMVGEMRHAGDLGTLLRVEQSLQNAVTKAREQFVLEQAQKQVAMPGMVTRPKSAFDLSGVSDERFFDTADERILAVLADFAAKAGGAQSVRRQLFADDASQGIAFIELCRKRFDVVLMNPPFGAASLAAKKEFEAAYPRTKNDLYAAFVERGIELLHPRGLLGAITSRTGFFLSTFQKWREEILLEEAPPIVFADLGAGVLDQAMVEVAAYCLQKEAAA